MDLQDEVLIERYKYVLAQKRSLNETTFKIVGLYQIGLFGLVAAQYKVLSESRCVGDRLDLIASDLIEVGLIVLSAFAIIFISVGMRSWIRYRIEEGDIEERVLGAPCRPKVGKSFLRWYETYLIFIVIVVLGAFIFWRVNIFPEVAATGVVKCAAHPGLLLRM